VKDVWNRKRRIASTDRDMLKEGKEREKMTTAPQVTKAVSKLSEKV